MLHESAYIICRHVMTDATHTKIICRHVRNSKDFHLSMTVCIERRDQRWPNFTTWNVSRNNSLQATRFLSVTSTKCAFSRLVLSCPNLHMRSSLYFNYFKRFVLSEANHVTRELLLRSAFLKVTYGQYQCLTQQITPGIMADVTMISKPWWWHGRFRIHDINRRKLNFIWPSDPGSEACYHLDASMLLRVQHQMEKKSTYVQSSVRKADQFVSPLYSTECVHQQRGT
eukprot:g74685.t1